MRYRFKQADWIVQLDSYNCGVFVVVFFELMLLQAEPSGLESTVAMQYFRYRILNHILRTM
jgi:hypothetical protein